MRPHLELTTPAWCSWTESDKGSLENVQRRAVGIISGLRAATYEEKLAEIGLVSLEETRYLQTFQDPARVR